MQLYLVFLILIVIALGPLNSCGSFLLFQSGAVGLDFFYVVRGRGRRGIDSLYEYPSDRSKLPLTILNYCLPNMGDIRATIEVNNGMLCDADLLVALCARDVVRVSLSGFGCFWPGSTLGLSWMS